MVSPNVDAWMRRQLAQLRYTDPPAAARELARAADAYPFLRLKTDYLGPQLLLVLFGPVGARTVQAYFPLTFPAQPPLVYANGALVSAGSSLDDCLSQLEPPPRPAKPARPEPPPRPPKADAEAPPLRAPGLVQAPPAPSLRPGPPDAYSPYPQAYSSHPPGHPQPPVQTFPPQAYSQAFAPPSSMPAGHSAQHSVYASAAPSAVPSSAPAAPLPGQRTGAGAIVSAPPAPPAPPVDLLSHTGLNAQRVNRLSETAAVQEPRARKSAEYAQLLAAAQQDLVRLRALEDAVTAQTAVLHAREQDHLHNIAELRAAVEQCSRLADDARAATPPTEPEEILDLPQAGQAGVSEHAATFAAINDVYDLLARCLDAGALSVHVYLRLVRQFARRQFYCVQSAPRPPRPPKA